MINFLNFGFILPILFMNFRKSRRYELVKDDKMSFKILNNKEIRLYNGVGRVELLPSNSEELEINVKKKVAGDSLWSIENMINKISITTLIEDDVLILKALYNDKGDLWIWKNEKYKGDISLDYSIKVPKNIEKLVCEIGVGNIEINKLNKSFNIKTGVGEILAREIKPILNNEFITGVGGIDIEASDIYSTKEILINANLGNIRLHIQNNLNLEIKTVSNNEKYIFCSDLDSEIHIITGLGNIKIY